MPAAWINPASGSRMFPSPLIRTGVSVISSTCSARTEIWSSMPSVYDRPASAAVGRSCATPCATNRAAAMRAKKWTGLIFFDSVSTGELCRLLQPLAIQLNRYRPLQQIHRDDQAGAVLMRYDNALDPLERTGRDPHFGAGRQGQPRLPRDAGGDHALEGGDLVLRHAGQ